MSYYAVVGKPAHRALYALIDEGAMGSTSGRKREDSLSGGGKRGKSAVMYRKKLIRAVFRDLQISVCDRETEFENL
jgi:hypothetical protein